MPYNGPPPVRPPIRLLLDKDKVEDFGEIKELDQIYHDRSEFTMSWQEHDFMRDEPTGKRSKAPAIFLGALCIMAFVLLVVALLAIPSIAEHARRGAPPSLEELGRQTCAAHGQTFVSRQVHISNVTQIFCQTGDQLELTERFIRAQ